MNRPPTPDAAEDQEKEPTLQEIINIKVCSSLKLTTFCILDAEIDGNCVGLLGFKVSICEVDRFSRGSVVARLAQDQEF